MIPWSLIYYILEWGLRVFMLVAITRRKPPGSAMAWLLIIFFLPIPGAILYSLVGDYRLPQRRFNKHRRLLEQMRGISEKFRAHPNIVRPQVAPDLTPAVNLARSLGEMPILGGNAAELFTDSAETVEKIVGDIDSAQHHVHMLFYIFADDESGRQVTDALLRARKRGVQCRLLLDSVGSKPMFRTLAPSLLEQGVEVHEAMPVGIFRSKFSRIDLRNHRKLVIVDGRIGYTGSQNIINPDYGSKKWVWEDVMIRIEGPVVAELQMVFAGDWYFETRQLLTEDDFFPQPETRGPMPIQLLPSGPNYPTENYQRLVVASLYGAHRHVMMTTPYFVPDGPLLQAMQAAANRGVKVDLIVPRKSNHPLVDAASRAYYEDLLQAGVNIHLYGNRLLHSKMMTIDDSIAFVGTGNFDIRSFTLNFEVSLIIYSARMTEQLRRLSLRYIKDSIPVELWRWRKRPEGQKVLQDIAKLLSPLL